MNHTLEDWAALLLADCSETNLLGFSGWLELDQDDEELAQAARGVRELLVKEGRRPWSTSRGTRGWSCVESLGVDDLRPIDEVEELSRDVYEQLTKWTSLSDVFRWYDVSDTSGLTPELAHYTALLDAAQAWVKCNPEPLTKGKVTT